MSAAIYNEIEPFAARWLRGLVAAGRIADGVVDERSIADLRPADVAGLGQRHFFAGIGGWSLACRIAGIDDYSSIWTGSCPCQGFSDAGRRCGFADERHLWPEWFRLIRECRPAVIFGEQVASKLGLAWLDLVFADLEGAGYACAAADLCAASAGAPHIRQRLYFVAYADGEPRRLLEEKRQPGRADAQAARRGEAGNVADSDRRGRDGRARDLPSRPEQSDAARSGTAHGVADAGESRLEVVGQQQARGQRETAERGGETRGVADAGSHECGTRRSAGADARGAPEPAGRGDVHFWSACDWIPCSDGVARPVEPGTRPLAHGVPGRVGLLRGYGNAIVPQVAAAFIRAALSAGGVQ